MTSLLGLPTVTTELKPITPFLQRAEELKGKDGPMAYWCAYYAAQVGIALGAKDSGSRTLLFQLLSTLETMKSEIGPNDAIDIEAASVAYVENFALKIFGMADNEDRTGEGSRATAKKFLAAANFLEVLKIFPQSGEASVDSNAEKVRYAKWKAGDIARAYREGRKHTPGPADSGIKLELPSAPESTPGISVSEPSARPRHSPPTQSRSARTSPSRSPPRISPADIARANALADMARANAGGSRVNAAAELRQAPQTSPRSQHLRAEGVTPNSWNNVGTPGARGDDSWSTAGTPGEDDRRLTPVIEQGTPVRKGRSGSVSHGSSGLKKGWINEVTDAPISDNAQARAFLDKETDVDTYQSNGNENARALGIDNLKKGVRWTPSVEGGLSTVGGDSPPTSPTKQPPSFVIPPSAFARADQALGAKDPIEVEPATTRRASPPGVERKASPPSSSNSSTSGGNPKKSRRASVSTGRTPVQGDHPLPPGFMPTHITPATTNMPLNSSVYGTTTSPPSIYAPNIPLAPSRTSPSIYAASAPPGLAAQLHSPPRSHHPIMPAKPAPGPHAALPVEPDLTPIMLAKAQKHCRFAISALDYEDAAQARKELRAALALLGG